MSETSGNRSEHFALTSKNLGPCRELLGEVHITLVFVNTPLHPWNEEKKDEVFRMSWSSIDCMQKEARRYGANVNMRIGWLEYNLPFEHDKELKWYYTILEDYFHTKNIADLIRYYETYCKADNAPIIFLFNSWDRSHCYMCTKDFPRWNEEFGVIFCDTQLHDNFLTHEFLHIYGAIDLYDYNNEGVRAIAEQYFPDSVMMKPTHVIDELTAYLIGWTKQPSAKVMEFLSRTKGLR